MPRPDSIDDPILAELLDELARHGFDGAVLRMKVWSRTTAVGDCWIFGGKHDRSGAPLIKLAQCWQPVRRLVWQFAIGRIPAEHCVRSRCRQVGCVRPEHLVANVRRDLHAACERAGIDSRCLMYWRRFGSDNMDTSIAPSSRTSCAPFSMYMRTVCGAIPVTLSTNQLTASSTVHGVASLAVSDALCAARSSLARKAAAARLSRHLVDLRRVTPCAS